MTTGAIATGPQWAGALPDAGDALVRSLESRAAAYHVKSDAHKLLLWEAAVVAARTTQLRTDRAPQATLATSVIAGAWQHDLDTREPDLLVQVQAFHRAADAVLASKDTQQQ